jgi:ribonuclease T2
VQLIQHQWAKHGSCATRNPEGYLRAGAILFRAIRYPDMNRLSRRNLTIGQLGSAIAAANRGVSADMLSVQTNRRGWLTEIRLCLGRNFRPIRCPGRRSRDRDRVRIWRGDS